MGGAHPILHLVWVKGLVLQKLMGSEVLEGCDGVIGLVGIGVF
jgi:hypothetical protein